MMKERTNMLNLKTRAILAGVLIGASVPVLAHGDGVQKPWGIAAHAKVPARTIEVTMTDDMRFTPSRIELRQGEVIRFVVKNNGNMLHEMVIGTKKELDEHAALMLKFPGMEHDEAHMIHVKAGRTVPLVWNFNRAGEFQFACLIPGHYQAGMFGTVVVAPAAHQGKKS
jgi:uncharacterized cupredoxin-like copper-binding protein